MKRSLGRVAGLLAVGALAVSTLAVGAMREHPRAGSELGRGAIEEPASPAVSPSTDVLDPATASALPATTVGTAATAPASSLASSATTGAAVNCIDLRSGVPFEYFAQRLLADGQLDTAWSGNTDRLCLGTTDDLRQIVCPDGAGGTYAGWVDARRGDTDIDLQHFDASGAIASGWPADGLPVCHAELSQYNLDLAPDGSGGVFLLWQDFRDRGAGDIYAQHVSASGALAAGWPEGGLAICAETHAQAAPHVAPDGSGGAYAVWQDRRDGHQALYGQHLGGDGAPAPGWPVDGAPLSTIAGDAEAPAVVADSTGALTVVWRQEDANGASVRAMHIGSGEAPGAAWADAARLLSAGTQAAGDPAIVMTAGGARLVVWSEWREGASTLRAQRLRADGTLDPTWPTSGLAMASTALGRGAPRILALADSGAIVGWEDFRDGTSDIYAQRVRVTGAIAAGWAENGVAIRTGAGEQYAPSLAADGSGAALITWADAATSSQAGFFGA